jgi:hypothetical protein
MPLSEPSPREHRHTRHLDMRGYRREDGLWDIEGHLQDTKTYTFENEHRGTVTPGTPVHDMWIRLTIDDTMLVRDIEVRLDKGPLALCPAITPNFAVLKGLRIAPGWFMKIKKLLGGVKGCVHLVEMLGPMGTVAYQTIGPSRVKSADGVAAGDARPSERPKRIDTCHALAADGEVVKKRWPEFYTGPKS